MTANDIVGDARVARVRELKTALAEAKTRLMQVEAERDALAAHFHLGLVALRDFEQLGPEGRLRIIDGWNAVLRCRNVSKLSAEDISRLKADYLAGLGIVRPHSAAEPCGLHSLPLTPPAGGVVPRLSAGGTAPSPPVGGAALSPSAGGILPSPAPGGIALSLSAGGTAPSPAVGGAALSPAPGGAALSPAPGGTALSPSAGGILSSPSAGSIVPSPAVGGAAPNPAVGGAALGPVAGGKVSSLSVDIVPLLPPASLCGRSERQRMESAGVEPAGGAAPRPEGRPSPSYFSSPNPSPSPSSAPSSSLLSPSLNPSPSSAPSSSSLSPSPSPSPRPSLSHPRPPQPPLSPAPHSLNISTSQPLSPPTHAWLIFDGPEENSYRSGAYRVTYTGGTGPQRADRLILDYVHAAKLLGIDTSRITVETGDKALARKLTALGAQILAPPEGSGRACSR